MARIHINGKNKVFLGRAAIGRRHCVEKERTRGTIDNGRTSDTQRINFSACEIICRHRRANAELPNNAAIPGVQRVHII
jgi:hypothetical protein